MTTTAQAFTAFVEKIGPTDAQRTDITSKREATEKYLRAAFPSSSTLPLNRVILMGSAARGTIIRPVNDLDVMAEFTNKDSVFERYRNDSRGLPPAHSERTRCQDLDRKGRCTRSGSPTVL